MLKKLEMSFPMTLIDAHVFLVDNTTSCLYILIVDNLHLHKYISLKKQTQYKEKH